MRDKADMNNTADELPSFFDEKDPANQADDVAVSEGAEPAAEASTGPADDLLDATPTAAAAEPARRPATARRRAAPREARQSGGALGIALGVVFLGFAIGLALAGQGLSNLAQFGVEPSTLLVLGVVMAAAGFTRRRIGALYDRFEEAQIEREQLTQDLTESLQFLVASQHASNERPPAAGEELQHVLVSIQRQDEKINNLTKAIKMYGKPLMEISGQATEIAGNLGQVRAVVDGGTESTRQALLRLEQQLRVATASKQDFNDLQTSFAKLGSTLTALEQRGGPSKQEFHDLQAAMAKVGQALATLEQRGGKVDLQPVQQSVTRVEVAVQAMAQRLEDSELRKSMLRLEDTTHKTHDQLQQLLRGESLQKATKELQAGLDGATKRLADGIKELRDGNLGGLESSVREIQREIAGVATAVAQIQNSVRNGARAAAPAPSAPTPATPAPAAPAAPAAAAAAPTPATAAAPAAGQAPADGYQTGTRSTPSKNVLGAIKKLKQMKS